MQIIKNLKTGGQNKHRMKMAFSFLSLKQKSSFKNFITDKIKTPKILVQ